MLLKGYGPQKELLGQGVLSLQYVKKGGPTAQGTIIAGAGDGSVAIINQNKEKFIKTR